MAFYFNGSTSISKINLIKLLRMILGDPETYGLVESKTIVELWLVAWGFERSDDIDNPQALCRFVAFAIEIRNGNLVYNQGKLYLGTPPVASNEDIIRLSQ